MLDKEKRKAVFWLLLIAGLFIFRAFYIGGQIGRIDAAAAIALGLLALNSIRPKRRRRPRRQGLKRGITMIVTGLLLIAADAIFKTPLHVMPTLVLIGFGAGWIMRWRYHVPAKSIEEA